MVKFVTESDGSFSFFEASWIHNHPVSREFFEAHFSCLTETELENIRQQQKLNIPAGIIRSNLGLTVNSDIFYEVRRELSKSLKHESLTDFEQQCSDSNYWRHMYLDETGCFAAVSFVHITVAQQAYASDMMIIDDTASVNIYELPVQVSLVVDAEANSQVLAFALLRDRTTESHVRFLRDIKRQTGGDPRVISCDRCAAQLSAIRQVFPSSCIVFCRVHLRRDLLKYFDASSQIIQGFDQVKDNVHACGQYIELLEQARMEAEDGTGRSIIDALLDNKDSWLPSRLLEQGIYDNWTTNRIEGFFGRFKEQYGFARMSAVQTCQRLILFSRLMLVQSEKKRLKTQRSYSGFTMFSDEDRLHIGKLALMYISEEYLAWLRCENNFPFCPWCHLRAHSPLSLPCRHVFNTGIDHLSIDDIHARYRVCDAIQSEARETDETDTLSHSQQSSFTDLMARLTPYASIAHRNPDVMSLFQKLFQDLGDIEQTNHPNMPPTLTVAGRLASHPARNVPLGGASKQKRHYTCSLCHQSGHNRATCPNRATPT